MQPAVFILHHSILSQTCLSGTHTNFDDFSAAKHNESYNSSSVNLFRYPSWVELIHLKKDLFPLSPTPGSCIPSTTPNLHCDKTFHKACLISSFHTARHAFQEGFHTNFRHPSINKHPSSLSLNTRHNSTRPEEELIAAATVCGTIPIVFAWFQSQLKHTLIGKINDFMLRNNMQSEVLTNSDANC
jgi:hypothetical protein